MSVPPMYAPFVDIHTHRSAAPSREVISVRSLRIDTLTWPQTQPYTLGLHPWYAEDMTDAAYRVLYRHTHSHSLWGIGEAGLDRLSSVSLETQRLYFGKQIELSEELGLPLVIHCVRAWGELLQMRRGCRMPWVIHGFRGKATLAEQLLSAGCHLSLGKYFRPEVLSQAHEAGRLLLETDESPITIEAVYATAAIVLDLPLEELRAELYHRFLTLSTPAFPQEVAT